MKRILYTILLYAFICTVAPAQRQADHLILIGLDGWGGYSMEKAEMPAVREQMARGSWTMQKRSVYPSSSAPNWASMFMGAGPELHCYTEWGSRAPEFPPRVTGRNGIFPTIFQIARDKYPEAEIGVLYDWDGIKYLVDTLSLSYHAQSPDYQQFPGRLADMAAEYIIARRPMLAAICFDEPDHTGHTAGHDTPAYYAKLRELDTYIARIIEALKTAGIYDSTVIIITADHGGIDKGHGGRTMMEMETPFIIAGPGISASGRFDDSMMQYDVAATIAAILDIPQPQVWTGRPVKAVLAR